MEERIYIRVSKAKPQGELQVVSSEADLQEIQNDWLVDFNRAIWVTKDTMLISDLPYPKDLRTQNQKDQYDLGLVISVLAQQVFADSNNVK